MKKERFDYVCSLGASCLCAMSLRDAGLRLSSGPLDWVGGFLFQKHVDFVLNDFADWFHEEDFEPYGDDDNLVHARYINRRNGLKFLHDFERGKSVSESLPAVREKYERRIARFYERIRSSRRVLFVWMENPIEGGARPTDGEVEEALAKLSSKFPCQNIEMLVVDRQDGGMRAGGIVRKNGFWRAVCEYRPRAVDPGVEVPAWDVDRGPFVALLSRFEVRDYRDKAERRRFEAEARRKKYAALGAKDAFGYAVARMEMRLFKSMFKRLRRRGIDMLRVVDGIMSTNKNDNASTHEKRAI
ncbi:MAG: hypothetical protein IKA69_04505 [Kiritimatiellae bacterium]|nr:hypothetical protein [Kiritimatiellia bacterium]